MLTRPTIVLTATAVILLGTLPAVAQRPNIPGYYIGGYSGGNNRGGYAGYYIGGYPTMSGRGDAGGYYIGGYPAVDALAIPGPGYPRYGPGFKGYATRFYPGYPDPYPTSKDVSTVALVDVYLPRDAELWFDGKRTSQIGDYRTFVTPALTAGKAYSYQVRARWLEDGRAREHSQEIVVRPGERMTVRFGKDSR
jgi:uncharacterized protein (TIGR03000 family)